MKAVVGSVVAAAGASACCLGPVIFSLVGAGAFGATAARLEAYRPYFLGLSGLLLAAGFRAAYRSNARACAADGACAPSSQRTARTLLWVATVLVVLLAAFPYYVTWLV